MWDHCPRHMMEPDKLEQQFQPLRFGLRTLFVAIFVLAVLFAVFGWFHRQVFEPHRHDNAIGKHLRSLAWRRPPEMSPRQWESAVAWTLNLHGNSMLHFEANNATMRDFNERLEQKLSGHIDMKTIEWIWDEYAELCPGGANYQRFRPQMLEEIEAGGGNWSLNVP